VVLIAAVVGVTWWRTSSDDHVTRSEFMLAETYPTAPQPGWTVNAQQFAHGDASPHFVQPAFGQDPSKYAGAIVAGGHIITSIQFPYGSDGAKQEKLSSFRLADGGLEWSVPGWPLQCAHELLGNTLPCITSEPGPQSTVGFIDVSSGATTSTVSIPYVVQAIASDGDSLYTGGYVARDNADPSEFVFAKGNPTKPDADWKVTVPKGVCQPNGESSLNVTHGIVWGSVGGGAYAGLRARDGSTLLDHDVTSVSVADDGSRITASRCTLDADAATSTSDAFDSEGHRLFTSQSRLHEPTIQAYTGATPPLVNRDGTGLDPTNGTPLWRSSVQGEELGPRFLIGDVFIGSTIDGLTAVDVHTGRPRWGWVRPDGHNGFSALTDGQRLLLSNDNGGIDAVNVGDGSEAWSIPLTYGEPPRLYATNAGVLAVSDTSMQLLRPTGPASGVPSVSGDTANSGGTKLITKCGSTPELKPEAIRTDGGTLVIRMKIIAHCPSGDVLSGSRTTLTVTSNGQSIASGLFDLSGEPIVMAEGSGGGNDQPFVEHEFRFPAGTFTLSPGVGLPGQSSSQSGGAELDATTLLVACDQSGSMTQTAQSSNTAPSSHTAAGPGGLASSPSGPPTFDSMRDFVTAYYGELPANVEDAWTELDPHLGNKNGHQDYVNFWNSVVTVSVLAVSPRDDTSVVARLHYLERDGTTLDEDRWLSFEGGGAGMKIYDSDVVK
jgi:hypothetical protein